MPEVAGMTGIPIQSHVAYYAEPRDMSALIDAIPEGWHARSDGVRIADGALRPVVIIERGHECQFPERDCTQVVTCSRFACEGGLHLCHACARAAERRDIATA